MRSLVLIAAAGLLGACGVVGAPVAPESIGVAPTIELQKKVRETREANERETAVEAEEQDPALLGQDETLPPLRRTGP